MPAVFLVGLLFALTGYVLVTARPFTRRLPLAPLTHLEASWGPAAALAVFALFIVSSLLADLAGVALAISLGHAEDSQLRYALSASFTYLFNLPTIFVIIRFAARSTWPSAVLGVSPVSAPRALRTSLVVFLFFIPIQIGWPFAVDQLWRLLSGSPPANQAAVELLLSADWPLLVVIFIAAVLLAPPLEELVFRAFVQAGFEKPFGRFPAVIVSSALFSGAHGDPATALKVVPLALSLSLLYARTRNLFLCILFHSLFNAFGVVLLLVLRAAGLDFPS